MKKLLIVIGIIVLVITAYSQKIKDIRMDHFTLLFIDQRGGEYSVNCDGKCDTLYVKMGNHFEGEYIKIK
jgi:hypothetical protein